MIQIHHTSPKVYLYSDLFIVLKLFSLDRTIAYGSLQHTCLYPFIPHSKEEGKLCIGVLTRLVSTLKENGKRSKPKCAYVVKTKSDLIRVLAKYLQTCFFKKKKKKKHWGEFWKKKM